MEMKTLLRASLKSHRGTVCGVFILIFLVSLSVEAVLTVWHNASRYVHGEMARLGYGDLTVWVSGVTDIAPLAQELTGHEAVGQLGVQALIFSEYETGGQESDSEGQLILYTPEAYPYRFFTDDLSGYRPAPAAVAPGEIYVPAAMVSMFGVQAGDRITFPIARSGVDRTFVVAGFFEDPFMGSSMIGMKGFLISGQDYEEISKRIGEAGINGLARGGFMLHIFQKTDSLSPAQFNALLNETTSLPSYAEFSHSKEAISGFMLTLQNVFTSLLLAFAAVLLLAALTVLSHSISSTMEQDERNMGIFKAMGFTGERLRLLQLLQYGVPVVCGMLAGTLISRLVAGLICRMTAAAIGLLIPAAFPFLLCLPALSMILLFLLAFVWLRTGPILCISPLCAIRRAGRRPRQSGRPEPPVRKEGLSIRLALRQIFSSGRQYMGACTVAVARQDF